MANSQHLLGLQPIPETGVDDPNRAQYVAALELVETDAPQALKTMETLAYEGSPMAMLFVADAMRRGSYYDLDLEKAEGWYWHAAHKGSGRAMYGLGAIYCLRGDYARAVETLEGGAQKGCGAAIHRLGKMYFDGEGVDADRGKALALWERGAALGYLWAKRSLYRALIRGGLGDKLRGAAVCISAIFDVPVIVFGNKYDRVFI